MRREGGGREMSGGSFNYLYSQELSDAESNIEGMRDYLHELGHHDAALRTADVLASLRAATDIQQELRDVWQAAEWCRSCDYGPDQVKESVESWRNAGKPASPSQVDVAKRLYDLEREAAALRKLLSSSAA